MMRLQIRFNLDDSGENYDAFVTHNMSLSAMIELVASKNPILDYLCILQTAKIRGTRLVTRDRFLDVDQAIYSVSYRYSRAAERPHLRCDAVFVFD